MRQLTVEDLLTLNRIPEIEELSLQVIALFFEQYLMNRQFYFSVKHKMDEVRIRFESGSLCHLLGIHHFVGGRTGRGDLGHRKILQEEITFASLQKINLGQFNKDRMRMLAFPLIYQVLTNENSFFQEIDSRFDTVRCHLMIHDQYGINYVELKLRRFDSDFPTFYAPVTVHVERMLPAKKKIAIKTIQQLPLDEGWN